MTTQAAQNTKSPATYVVRWALGVGFVSFLAGFIGPMIFSPSNLGPILGIFVTGPVGTLVGALIGVVRAAQHGTTSGLSSVLKWLAGVWIAIMLYTLFMIVLDPRAALLGAVLLALVAAVVSFLLSSAAIHDNLPNLMKQCGSVLLAGLAILTVMTLFPPVVRPPWWPRTPTSEQSAMRLPRFAFVLDSRFEASHHMPLLAADRRMLVNEWIVAIALALVASAMVARSRNSPAARG
jgi:hypothetical protein